MLLSTCLHETMAKPPASWYDQASGELSFSAAWQTVLDMHGGRTAVIIGKQSVTYCQLHEQAASFQTNECCTPINGRADDWLARAIGAWLSGSTVIFFDGDLKKPPHRSIPLPIIPEQSHALFFTSGTTGTPKPIVRSTEFALTEAWLLAEDLKLTQDSTAVCLIKPWFGAMTKHVLGLLLTGVAQRFSLPTASNSESVEYSVLYGTPSQVLQTSARLQWDVISITGEYLTQNLADALTQRLTNGGVVYDALGSTECGVIARRWLSKDALKCLPTDFQGASFPHKAICVDEKQRLSVDAYGSGSHLTGDIATMDDGKITLQGRASSLRKLHGLWVDATPLLAVLRADNDITMAHLQSRANELGQLVVDVCLTPDMSLKALETKLFQQLPDLRLFPQLRQVAINPELSATGKSRMTDEVIDVCEPERLSESIAKALLGTRLISEMSPVWGAQLDSLGLDSLDINELAVSLERELSYPLTDQILKSDTLSQIASGLVRRENNPIFFRQLGSASAPLEVICLGKSLTHIYDGLEGDCSFQFTPALRAQDKAYTLESLALDIIQGNEHVLKKQKVRVIAGFSVEALLAAELAFQMQNLGLSVSGVFLLDPPGYRRKRWLKLRQRLFGSLPHKFSSSTRRVQREVRRDAIALQPTRHIESKTLVLERAENWPGQWVSSDELTVESIAYSSHNGLVSEEKGRASWRPAFDQWIHKLIAEDDSREHNAPAAPTESI